MLLIFLLRVRLLLFFVVSHCDSKSNLRLWRSHWLVNDWFFFCRRFVHALLLMSILYCFDRKQDSFCLINEMVYIPLYLLVHRGSLGVVGYAIFDRFQHLNARCEIMQ